MPESQKTLTEMQAECRRFAAQIGDPEVSRILCRAADDLEQYSGKGSTEKERSESGCGLKLVK
jgi:hypothetical protein